MNRLGAIFGYISKSGKIKNDVFKTMSGTFKNTNDFNYWKDEDETVLLAYSNDLYNNKKRSIINLESIDTIIIGDIIIYDRHKIFGMLDNKSGSDLELFAELYLLYGQDAFEKVNGAFAVSIYNYQKKELIVVKDKLSKRSLYYIDNNVELCFSSNITALVKISSKFVNVNKLWVANYLSTQGPLSELDGVLTIYEGVLQLSAASYLSYDCKKFIVKKYWKLRRKKISRLSDQEYIDAFLKLWRIILDDYSKIYDNIGLLLSGGMDSNAIAVTLTKPFKAYTAVPLDTYIKKNNNDNLIAHEGDTVEETKKIIKNMMHSYEKFEGYNSYNTIDELLEFEEQPYNTFTNKYWIDNISRIAKKDGCKALMHGHAGNNTFSAGDILTHLFTCTSEFRIVEFFQSLFAFSRRFNIRKAKILREYIKKLVPINLYQRLSGEKFESLASIQLIDECGLLNFYKKNKLNIYQKRAMNYYDLKCNSFHDLILAQIGNAQTKRELKYGVHECDPTSDERLLQFCMDIPYDQFFKNGIGRSLYRRAFINAVPESIINNVKKTGWQSADFCHRNSCEFIKLENEINSFLKNDNYRTFLSIEKIEKYIHHLYSEDELIVTTALNKLLRIVTLGRFLQRNQFI